MEALLDPITLHSRLRAASLGRPWRLAGWAVFVAVVAVWGAFLRPELLGGPATYLIVAGHSMEPKLHSGDFVIALRQRTYHRGDVIAYHIPKNQAGAGALVIHRIVGGSARDGYITRGDNRNYRDPWRPKWGDIAGKMRLHAPRLGLVPVYAHTLLGMALVAAFVGFLILRGGGGGAGDERSDGPPEGDEEGDDDESAPPEPAAEGDAEIPTGDEDIGVVEDAEVERHLLFSSSPTGYQLLQREGGPPAAGTVVDDGERFHRVAKLGPSPLPFDRRLCAYLEPA